MEPERSLPLSEENTIGLYSEAMNPDHNLLPCFFTINITVALPSTSSLPSGHFASGFPTKTLRAFTSLLTYACNMPHPFCSSSFYLLHVNFCLQFSVDNVCYPNFALESNKTFMWYSRKRSNTCCSSDSCCSICQM